MAISEGCYLLRTNLTQSDPAALWKQYIQLTDAEWAFRIHKDELALRPNGWRAAVWAMRREPFLKSSTRLKSATSFCRPGMPMAPSGPSVCVV